MCLLPYRPSFSPFHFFSLENVPPFHFVNRIWVKQGDQGCNDTKRAIERNYHGTPGWNKRDYLVYVCVFTINIEKGK